ncbi:MAG: tetratricopeptide repeat protein [Clostridium sp.]|nr:tetratricopeptide repeat protein [Clostridium sp.]
MSLILCRQEPVKHPYYIDVLGIHIHSSQELCYVIYNHPMLVMDDFVDELLIGFIRRELDMDYLAGRMEKLMETGSRTEDVLILFMSECDYYSEKEIQKFKATVSALRSLHPAQYDKERADYMFGQRQFGKAAGRYEKVLEYPRDRHVDDGFLAKVYNNLGASYAMMFQFHRALQAYDKAYALGKSPDVLKRIYFLTIFAPELDVKERYQALFTQELAARWRQEADTASLDAGQAEEVRALRALFKKDPVKRMSGAAEMVRRWKQEYRMMV